MNVFFPRFFLESHRTPAESARVVVELAKRGISCELEITARTDAVFVGGLSPTEDAAEGYTKIEYNRVVDGYRTFPHIPVVHYCWDLYPWVVDDLNHPDRARWVHYLNRLKEATEIWVPTTPVAVRVKQYLNRDAKVMGVVISPWAPAKPPENCGYVVDVMRPYPADPNCNAVEKSCNELGIPWRKTGASLPWDEYRDTIANAALLVSAYHEASTGSLALLDGYALGKPILLSDSKWNGGKEIFKYRAYYFNSDSSDNRNLKAWISDLSRARHDSGSELRARVNWVEANYGEAAFAERVAAGLRRVCGKN